MFGKGEALTGFGSLLGFTEGKNREQWEEFPRRGPVRREALHSVFPRVMFLTPVVVSMKHLCIST